MPRQWGSGRQPPGSPYAVGPVFGGWLLEHFSWSSVFWVNVPMAVVAAAGVLLAVPATQPVSVSRFDAMGLALSIAGLGLLTYSVIEGPHFGWTDIRTIAGLVVAAAVLALFARRELSIADPILDIRLFANRFFATAAAMISVAFFALFGFIFLITQYFQAVKGYGPLEAGVHTAFRDRDGGVLADRDDLVAPVRTPVRGRDGSAVLSGGFALVELATPDSSLLAAHHRGDDADGGGFGIHLRPLHADDHGCAFARTGRCGFGRQRHHS